MPLGLQGTYAGRGDLVQVRRNAWDLTGYRGDRQGQARQLDRLAGLHLS
ncbi:MAG: hypothetical protein M3332_10020 [Actinomycetota bacterium]|nr:hypothetical protein [Actinomycetota bacterium]